MNDERGCADRSRKNREFETLTQVQWGQWTVRVWRAAARPGDMSGAEAVRACIAQASSRPGLTPEDLAEALEALDGVSAIAITDAHGNGWTLYPDWRAAPYETGGAQ